MNARRKLMIALGAGALAAPFGAFAQQGKVWRVGFLTMRSRPSAPDPERFGAYLQGMRELGYVEGKNLIIEWRFADGNVARLQRLSTELVQLKLDAILTDSTTTTRAARNATTETPIITMGVSDPVGVGFVKSLARPEGNVTGSANFNEELAPKQLEMLLSIAPKLSRVAVLINPSNTSHLKILEKTQAAGQKLGVKILRANAQTSQEINDAFAQMVRENARAVVVVSEPIFTQVITQIAALAARYHLLSIYPYQEHAEAGGLLSYGPRMSDQYRRAAIYVDKIFKGAKPGDLPMEQPRKFDMFINAKTAKALGLTIPQSLLIGADKVIE